MKQRNRKLKVTPLAPQRARYLNVRALRGEVPPALARARQVRP